MGIEHPIEWNDEQVSRLWNYYSKTVPYSEVYFSRIYGNCILKKSGIPFKKEISVLDFGCGPGFIWDHIINSGITWSYTGLDFSLDSVEALVKKAAGHPQFKGAVLGSQLPTKFQDNCFDAVLLFEVIEHLTDEHLDETLQEVRRVLKPGGVVVVTTPNEEDLSVATKYCPECNAIFHEWQHIRSWSVDTLSDYLLSRGFDLQFATPVDFSEQNVLQKIKLQAKRLLAGRHKLPHLIASFTKIDPGS
jgi:SAM-dependent methyltransferase